MRLDCVGRGPVETQARESTLGTTFADTAPTFRCGTQGSPSCGGGFSGYVVRRWVLECLSNLHFFNTCLECFADKRRLPHRRTHVLGCDHFGHAGVGKSSCRFFGMEVEVEWRVDFTSERSVYIVDAVNCSLITVTIVGKSLQKDQEYDVLKKKGDLWKDVSSIGLHLVKSAPSSSARVDRLRIFCLGHGRRERSLRNYNRRRFWVLFLCDPRATE